MRPRCPFYGFRWPGRTTEVTEVGGDECGLDFDRFGPCEMEREGRDVNFECCPVAMRARTFLEVVGDRVRFLCRGAGEPVRYRDWMESVMRRRRTPPSAPR